MKRVMLFFIVFLLPVLSGFAEKRYVIKKIHDEGSNYFDLNNRGEVAFVGLDAQERQFIYLYSEGAIHQITEIPAYRYSYFDLDLNDNSQIVWAMESWEDGSRSKGVVMLWDGVAVRKVADSLYKANLNPRINNPGTMVWHLQPYYGAYSHVYMNNGVTTQLTTPNNPNGWPQINNNGLIAWHGDNRAENQYNNRIRYLLPGETEVRAVPMGVNEGASGALVDDLNNIVYNLLHYSGSWYSICLFDGKDVKTIADSVYHYAYSVNNGNVAYLKLLGGKIALYRYDGSGHARLSLPETDNYDPMINSSGMVAWKDSKYQVYVSREGGSKMVGADCHKPPKINDNGMIAFAGYDWDLYGSAIYIGEYKDVFDITGKVVKDGSGGMGLPGVSIVMDNKVIATTDAAGEFKCENLEPGEVTLSFALTGYTFDPQVVTISLNSHYTISPDILARQGSGLEEVSPDPEIRVYPNPASMGVTIEVAGQDLALADIRIYNDQGKMVKEAMKPGFPFRLDVSGLSQGNYFLIIGTDKREIRKPLTVIR